MKPWLTWFSAAFLAVGIPWWTAPYNHFTLSHPLAILGCLVLVCLSAGAVPCAVMVRVLVDVVKEPTSHNLWPFEVVLAGLFGFGLAYAAGLMGLLCRRMLKEG